MDKNLCAQEKTALKAISKHMKTRLKKSVDYIYPGVKEKRSRGLVISGRDLEFWDKCVDFFEKDLENCFARRIRVRKPLELNEDGAVDVPHSDETVAKDLKTVIDNFFADVENKLPEDTYYLTPMYNFKCVVNLLDEFNLTDNQRRVLRKQIFQLCQQIERYEEDNFQKRKNRAWILGTTDFTCLPYLLDIHQKNVYELLPYLLTAYTFNVQTSRFFHDNKTLLPLICPVLGKNFTGKNLKRRMFRN